MGNKTLRTAGEQFLLVILCQFIFIRFLKINGIFPNLFLVWIVYLSSSKLDILILIIPFLGGFVYDIMVKSIPGWSSLFFSVIAYCNSFLPNKTSSCKMISCLVFSIIYFLLLPVELTYGFMWEKTTIAKYTLLFSFYNMAIVGCLEFCVKRVKWIQRNFLET